MAKTKDNKNPKGYSYNNNNNNKTIPNNRKRASKRMKTVSWRDEQIQGMSVSDIDPAILVVGNEIAKIRYTREELLKFRESPASKKKPTFLDPNEVSPSILDPEKWNFERKKSDTPTENGPRLGDISDHRRRPGDPRERIRKENDGIVLSPQRRSFNSGCFVPVRETATRTNRPHSPLGKNEPTAHIGVREIQPGTRRIGSGRILRDSWDFGDQKSDSNDNNDFGFGGGVRGGPPRNNNEREDKFERRSFGREFDLGGRDKEKEGGRRNGRYSERRRISEHNHRDEEPEWFSGGPISQNDTIELRGFDESDKPANQKKKISASRVKRAKEWSEKKNSPQSSIIEEKAKDEEGKGGSVTPTPQAGGSRGANGQQQKKGSNGQGDNGKTDGKQDDHSFNFDEILKCDTIPGLLTNGVSGDGDSSKSRFSRWFKKESPDKAESRRSSIQEDNHVIKDLLKDIGETNVNIPGDSESYFAPISPAANTNGPIGNKPGGGGQPINIMEMLQRGKQGQEAANVKQSQMSGKILSLDELEAKMRKTVDVPAGVQQKNPQQKPDEEMTTAFKRLLAQAGGHSGLQNGPMPKSQPMSLLEMLNHSQRQDEAARLANNPPHVHHPNMANDITLKLQQAQLQKQQMDMLNKLINAGIHAPPLRASPLHDIGMQQSRELLNRPEAQAILQAMHQRIPSPRELQVHTQNILQRALIKKKLEEQTENYRKKQEMQRGASPNTNINPGTSKNVSSPTPLAFTPTSVLRKMTADKDEAKENKAGVDTPKPPGRALTGMRPQLQPTGQQWNQQQQFPVKQPVKSFSAGRPIVKANSNYQPVQTQTEAFFNQQQQQQRLYNQQQTAPQNQQRKGGIGQQQQQAQYPTQMPTNGATGVQQYNPAPYQTNQAFSQQLTQQQLRAQHQHRPVNQQAQQGQGQGGQLPQGFQPQQQQGANQPTQGGNQQRNVGAAWQKFLNSTQQNNRNMGRSGQTDGGDLSPTTTNQLARWFSPDLLERARGGELPSTAGLAQHALSLEEIERQTQAPSVVHN